MAEQADNSQDHAQDEAKAKAEAEAKKQADADAKAKAKAEAEAKKKAEADAKAKAQDEAKAKAERERNQKALTSLAEALQKTGTGQAKLDIILASEDVEAAVAALRAAGQKVTAAKAEQIIKK